MPMAFDSNRLRSDVVRRAYAYWSGKLDGDRLPARADIRPEELRHLLAWIFLVDVTHNPLRFRYRLIGSEITRLAGVERTGSYVDAAGLGPYWRRVHDDYRAVVRRRVPSYVDGGARWNGREFQHHERLVMPLASDGAQIDMLFGVLHPTDPPD